MASRLLPGAAAALFAVAGSTTAFLAGASAVIALPVGAGVGGLVWAAHAVTDRLARPTPSASARPAAGRPGTCGADPRTARKPRPGTERGGDAQSGRSAPPADAARWLARAAAAADRLEDQYGQSAGAALMPALATAATSVRAAADRLTAAAEAVRVVDATAAGAPADPAALLRDQERLEEEARALPDGPLRRATQDAARATGERVATLRRLAELRQLLMTTMEATALRLEAAAERGAMLLSLHAATDASAVPTDLTALDHELEAVQAGLDTLDEITHSLHDRADGPSQ
jgi:hypothetical protein